MQNGPVVQSNALGGLPERPRPCSERVKAAESFCLTLEIIHDLELAERIPDHSQFVSDRPSILYPLNAKRDRPVRALRNIQDIIDGVCAENVFRENSMFFKKCFYWRQFCHFAVGPTSRRPYVGNDVVK